MADQAPNRETRCPACSTVLTVPLADADRWTRCPKCNRAFVPAENLSQLSTKNQKESFTANKPEKAVLTPERRPVPPSQVSLLSSMFILAKILLRIWVGLISLRTLLAIRFYNLWESVFYCVVIIAMLRPRWFCSTDD